MLLGLSQTDYQWRLNGASSKIALQENRVIVTQDLDFSQLVAISGNAKPSLVTLRLSASDPETITQTLRRVLPQITTALQEGSAVTIDDKNVRVRPLPIR